MRGGWVIAGLLAASAWAADPAWESKLSERIPLYGHRNWIVIADSAYPAQAREGIETIVVNADQLRVLKHVLAALDASKHVRPSELNRYAVLGAERRSEKAEER